MILYIDTTDFNKVTFAVVDKKTIKQSYTIDPHKSHETLAKLDEFLKLAKIYPHPGPLPSTVAKAMADKKGKGVGTRVTKIIVNKGPGSYTGVRVGVTHALALGFAWGVPVKALANEKFIKDFAK